MQHATRQGDAKIIQALHARIHQLEEMLASVGAGGVEPLVSRKLAAQDIADSALLGNIESPFNACMHQEHCKQLKHLAAHIHDLLEAMRQLKMWLPIITYMAGLDAEETQVEFSEFPDNRPPMTISIASSLRDADAAIAKAGGTA